MFRTKCMLFAVVALLAVGSSVAVIGGQDAAPGQFPYYVLLHTFGAPDTTRTIQQNCGGALLTNQWIVTCARCLASTVGAEVHLGVQKLNERYEKSRKIFNVTDTDYFIHPAYKESQPFVDDIALIKLRVPVKFSNFIQPILLTDSIIPTVIGKDVISMGYGLKNLIVDGIPENLQYTTFRITNFQKCVPESMKSISKIGLVCAQVVQGRLCYGDIGGPFVSPDTGKLLGIAISSAGGDCVVGRWQSFSDIATYSKWIEGMIYVESQTRLHY